MYDHKIARASDDPVLRADRPEDFPEAFSIFPTPYA